MRLVDKLVAEEHHLADVAREGNDPQTLPIVMGALILALAAIVAVVLALSFAAYYWF
jgi:hypothetical protein